MLDHHKTAAENLAGAAAPNLEVTLDMDRSGATIARDHFAPRGLTDAQQARGHCPLNPGTKPAWPLST